MYKPHSYDYLLKRNWWNPLFWTVILISFIYLIVEGVGQGLKNCWELIADLIFNYEIE